MQKHQYMELYAYHFHEPEMRKLLKSSSEPIHLHTF